MPCSVSSKMEVETIKKESDDKEIRGPDQNCNDDEKEDVSNTTIVENCTTTSSSTDSFLSLTPLPTRTKTFQSQQNCFKNLTHLDISGNSAEKLDLRSLSRLEWLCCSNNNLEALTLCGSSLIYLDCSHNNLLSISVDPVPNKLSTLQISLLQDTDERDALDFLLECNQLRRLYLAFNKIEHINERYMTVWRPLEEFVICGNRIRTLPSKITTLHHLRVLRVHSNRLENVPNLSKMPNLRVVDMSHNNLKKINLENLISGGTLSYLDISCNERLSLDPNRFSNPKRPMNLVEVSNPRKVMISGMKDYQEYSIQPPWELGFSELPDRNQSLSVTQYRDVNLSNGREALFGLFDGGEGNQAPKAMTKSIARIYDEEKHIEETHKFSLKYTLLSAMKNIIQQGNNRPLSGILCLLSVQDEDLIHGRPLFMLNVAMIGGVKCILIESGGKIRRITDNAGTNDEDNDTSSETSSTKSSTSTGTSSNNLSCSTNIPDPKILSVPLSKSVEYLIIANQSLWNYISEKELLDEIHAHRHQKSVLIAKRITDMAQSHTCKQSLSVILVRFRWNYVTSMNGGDLRSSHKRGTKVMLGDFGPLSYCSGSSDYSGSSSPINIAVSAITPDSAIDTDRSSGAGSMNSSKRSSDRQHNGKNQRNTELSKRKSKKTIEEEEIASIANTSISQMSVEQFRCWEYMLEQNTRLLFKKELDSLSKAAFARNNKLRKSVHFPYSQENASNNSYNSTSNTATNIRKLPSSNVSSINLPANKNHQANDAGFYTLSKAKSLSHLFAADNNVKIPAPCELNSKPLAPLSVFNANVQYNVHNNGTNGNAFLGPIQRNSGRRSILTGGPNAAYFGSVQRLVPPSMIPALYCDSAGEIQEIRNFDSMEHENRLKKYWDSNKVTEL